MILLVLYSKVCLVSPDMKHTAIELALTLHSLYCLFVDKCNKVLCCFHVVKAQIRTVQTRDWNSSQIWHWHLNTICIDDRYTGRTLHVSDICHMIHETVAQADLHYIRYHNCCKSLFHSLHICLHTVIHTEAFHEFATAGIMEEGPVLFCFVCILKFAFVVCKTVL